MVDRGELEIRELAALARGYRSADQVERIQLRNEAAQRLYFLARWIEREGWIPDVLIEWADTFPGS